MSSVFFEDAETVEANLVDGKEVRERFDMTPYKIQIRALWDDRAKLLPQGKTAHRVLKVMTGEIIKDRVMLDRKGNVVYDKQGKPRPHPLNGRGVEELKQSRRFERAGAAILEEVDPESEHNLSLFVSSVNLPPVEGQPQRTQLDMSFGPKKEFSAATNARREFNHYRDFELLKTYVMLQSDPDNAELREQAEQQIKELNRLGKAASDLVNEAPIEGTGAQTPEMRQVFNQRLVQGKELIEKVRQIVPAPQRQQKAQA